MSGQAAAAGATTSAPLSADGAAHLLSASRLLPCLLVCTLERLPYLLLASSVQSQQSPARFPLTLLLPLPAKRAACYTKLLPHPGGLRPADEMTTRNLEHEKMQHCKPKTR